MSAKASCENDGQQVLEDGSLEKIFPVSGRPWAEGQIQVRLKHCEKETDFGQN